MKVDSVCERIKIWAERKIGQTVTLDISPEGDILVQRRTVLKTENGLYKESFQYPDVVLMEPKGKVRVKVVL